MRHLTADAAQEIKDALKPKPKIPNKAFLMMTVGSAVEIVGVPCRLHHINRGKRRLTFSFGAPSVTSAEDLSGAQPGSLVKVLGVYCRLERVDRRKGRWTFTPNDPKQRMPVPPPTGWFHRAQR